MRPAIRRLLVLTALIGATGSSSIGAQGILMPRVCNAPLPMPGQASPFAPCRVGASIVRTSTNVRVRLTDRVLHYEVDERFVNRGNVVGEADYVFPLPNNAAFQDLELEINGEMVSGETYGATEARKMYEEIVRRQRDPALVEWMGHGMLRAHIFPIAPGEEKRVVVRYQSVAVREGDAVRVDYFGGAPTDPVQGTRAGQPPLNLTLTYPRAGFGRAYSPTHELDMTDRGGDVEVSVRGDARDATLLVPVMRSSAPAISVLTNAPGREDGFAMVTVAPPAERNDRQVTPRDITLVLDISGSMTGPKMEQARAAGRQVLETLQPRDRFRMIDFSTDVHTFRDDYVSATSDNIQAARRYLDGLEASGSTNIEGALKEAMRGESSAGRLPLVLFITDGEPTIGERNPDRLVELVQHGGSSQPGEMRFFTFGLGADVNVTLLEQLALDGHGTAQFVRPDESVERAVGIVASRLVDPVLTDVRVHADGPVSLTKMQPAAGSDLFAGQDLVVLARYTGSGSSRVVIEGRQNGKPVQWSTTVNFPDRAPENPFVARLWAAQRIGYLSAERRKSGGSPELDEEIKTLGERFSIPTEFTSYFVAEPGIQTPVLRASMGITGTGGGQGAATNAAPKAAPAPMQAQAAMQFSAARMEARQRAISSVGALDAVTAELQDKGSMADQRVGGRTFHIVAGIWTDLAPAGTKRMVTIQAYSAAYFDLLKRIPELSPIFVMGEQVRVVGKGIVIDVRTNAGLKTLSGAELDRMGKEW